MAGVIDGALFGTWVAQCGCGVNVSGIFGFSMMLLATQTVSCHHTEKNRTMPPSLSLSENSMPFPTTTFSSPSEWVVVILAAGYGTRLGRDIDADTTGNYAHLKGLPKALLPIGGEPLLNHWINQFKACPRITQTYLVTNHLFYDQFVEWGKLPNVNVCESHIVDNGTTCNEDRNGAVVDLKIAIDACKGEIGDRHVLCVASDLLLYDDFSLSGFLEETMGKKGGDGAILYYNVSSEDAKKRGIVTTDEKGKIVSFVEKPQDCDEHKLHKASPAFYAYAPTSVSLIDEYIERSTTLEEVDAPGKFMAWLMMNPAINIFGHKISGRFDIGNLKQAKETIEYYSQVTEDCCARAALMGNPSDGFGGATLALLIKNFKATVTISENDDEGRNKDDGKGSIHLIPHPVLDNYSFSSLQGLHDQTNITGYYGGLRLIHAACKKFYELAGHLITKRGFQIKYDTDIPRSVGLSGSSAIVTAAFRALLRFHHLPLGTLGLTLNTLPEVILGCEVSELNISAGLQDRVVQSFGGLVYMDFHEDHFERDDHGKYESLDLNLLPTLYLAYSTKLGGESGKVHAPVKQRFADGDKFIIERMRELGDNTLKSVELLTKKKFYEFGLLMERNFQLRREMYGDECVGLDCIKMIAIAKAKFDIVCKFSGSGGCFVCMVGDKDNAGSRLGSEKMGTVVEEFRNKGFIFEEIIVS